MFVPLQIDTNFVKVEDFENNANILESNENFQNPDTTTITETTATETTTTTTITTTTTATETTATETTTTTPETTTITTAKGLIGIYK
jgi:hypothetical protein